MSKVIVDPSLASVLSGWEDRISVLERQVRLNASLGGAVQVVTALPTQAVDGQEVCFVADATNGTVWRFKYRQASASTFKWEFVGGSSLHKETATSTALTGTTITALNGGMNLTLPFAGDYLVTLGAAVTLSASGSGATQTTYLRLGGTTLAQWQHNIAALFLIDYPYMPAERLAGRAAGDVLTMAGNTIGATTTGNWGPVWMDVTPVRVG